MSEKGTHAVISGAVVRAAEKLPEENYSFKATPDVRSFGQLVGQWPMLTTCSVRRPQVSESGDGHRENKDPKADLVSAIKDAVAYCNKTFDGMTDAKGSQMVKLFNFNLAKLTLLSLNTAHTDEHYGNMVTYLRLKGIVPPTAKTSRTTAKVNPRADSCIGQVAGCSRFASETWESAATSTAVL